MNKINLALSESIKSYVDDLLKREDPAKNILIPHSALREKLEMDVHQELDHSELKMYVSQAVNVIRKEGKRYLLKEDYDNLIQSLISLRRQIETLDLSQIERQKNPLHISNESQAAILKIGIEKFKEKKIDESLSIFAFLATLSPENPDYWHRLGLAAQEAKLYDLALLAYSAVLKLAPEFIGAHVFKAECHLINHQRNEALQDLAEIKSNFKTAQDKDKWVKQVAALENLLAKGR